MSRSLAYAIYNVLLPFVLLVGTPRFLAKGLQRGGLRRGFLQRLGLYRPDIRARLAQPGNLWIHAVSVGEILVALKLIREILRRRPEARVVLSTTTTTGYSLAAAETAGLAGRVAVIHNPVDLPWITRSALRLIRPERLILVEAEIWPNLVRQASALGIPVILVNARLSDRSERRFQRFAALTRPIFSLVDKAGVPFESDAPRWAGLGMDPARVVVTGSVKFDEEHQEDPLPQIADLRHWLDRHGVPGDSPLLLGGSTHPGEEALLARTWLELRPRHPGLVLVLVPRHAERARDIAAGLRDLGLRAVPRQPWRGGPLDPPAPDPAPPVYLANTTGELRAWFHLASVVVIGKSFLGRGGQNAAEAVQAGKPVIVGPHMENFRAVVSDLLDRGGLVQVGGGDELPAAASRLLENPEAAAALAARGKEALARHRGATARSIDLIWDSGEGAA